MTKPWKDWRWWLGLIIQGKGYSAYPPIIKYPPILYYTRRDGELLTPNRLYGVCWHYFDRDLLLLIYFPFNLPIKWLIKLYYYTRYPTKTKWELELGRKFREGYRMGCVETEQKILGSQ